jgi:hypothetical protein
MFVIDHARRGTFACTQAFRQLKRYRSVSGCTAHWHSEQRGSLFKQFIRPAQ